VFGCVIVVHFLDEINRFSTVLTTYKIIMQNLHVCFRKLQII
jgi:hypothetical protein